jgi:hypothetical protein
MVNKEQIENYIDYFQRQVELVASLSGDPAISVGSRNPSTRVALHKKILSVAILDSLAALRYAGMGFTNHGRFTRLLADHAGWPEGHLVSVPVLAERLRDTSGTLSRHCANVLARHSTMSPNSLPLNAFDSDAAMLLPLASSKDERTAIKKSTHFELFYRYRNYIVHEFREPGYAMEVFAEGEQPRYHGYIGEDRWHLLYPFAFFQFLLRKTLESIEHYYTASDLDPYENLESSSAW